MNPIDNDSPNRRHAKAVYPEFRDRGKMLKPKPGAPAGGYDPIGKTRNPGMKLSALDLQPGDNIRPVSDASGHEIKDGKVWTFCHVDLEDQFFGTDPVFPERKAILLASSYGWELVERAYKGITDDVTVVRSLSKSIEVEKIVAAAVQIEGVTISLPQPARYGTILACVSFSLNIGPGRELQGFLTSTGRFVNRIQARHIADIAGQKPGHSGGHGNPELFSEDLW